MSLMVTSLMTSVHDTTVSDLNRGFKEATTHFNKLKETTQQILKSTSTAKDIDTIIEHMENTWEVIAEDLVAIGEHNGHLKACWRF